MATADAVVFVKELPSPRVIKSAKEKYGLVIYDPIDNFDFVDMALFSGRHTGEAFDMVFAANCVHADKLRMVFPESIVKVVPHHHCVHEGTFLANDSPVVGYVGEPCNLGLNASLLSIAFPGFVQSRALRDLRRIGIGIAYRPPGIGRSYKSTIKMANYWAHGVATVCFPESSYVEMQEGRDPAMMIVENETDAVRAIGTLVKDEGKRRALAEAGLRYASHYSIRSISKLYISIIEEHL